MLHIHKASKQFHNSIALNQVSLTIEANNVVGLAGPSGSGKSTLLRCIQKLESLDSGEIKFNGISGFMFQDFQLFPHMNILKNLTYAPALQKRTQNHNEKAMELLKDLGISDKAYAFPQQLSGGQKQRAALARSLMMQPDLLLCDEPTSGLDMASTKDVLHLLQDVQKLNVTLIIASHDLPFLTQIAQRLMVIKYGTIVADFTNSPIADPISYIQQFYQGEFQ